MERVFYHISRPAAWQLAQTAGVYKGDTLATEGFIHCSTGAQIARSANKFYPNQHGLILLAIEADKVTSEIKYEDGGNNELFPHIYGPLNVDAVSQVLPFEPNAEGKFEFTESERA